MIAAIRSRLECSASESTPRLPVDAVRKIFSDKSTTAEPTDASAAICFDDVALDVEMCALRIALAFPAIIRRCGNSPGANGPLPCATRTNTREQWMEARLELLQRRRRHQRRASRLPVRPAHFDLLEQQRRRNNVARNPAVRAAERAQGRSRRLGVLALRIIVNAAVVPDPQRHAQIAYRQLRNQ